MNDQCDVHIKDTCEQLTHVFAMIWVDIKAAQVNEVNGSKNDSVSSAGRPHEWCDLPGTDIWGMRGFTSK